MLTFRGKGVSEGIAIGKIHVYKKTERQLTTIRVEDVEKELARFHGARSLAMEQLTQLYESALQELGQEKAAIFEVYRMLLEDRSLIETIERIIQSQAVNAEYAVTMAGDEVTDRFAAMEDAYLRERAADIKDIVERLLEALEGGSVTPGAMEEAVIIVAKELTPSETMQMDREKVLSFVTVEGSVNSHAAILSRTMGIPSLVGVKLSLDDSIDGKMGIVDGVEGVLYVEPDDSTLACMQKKYRDLQEKEEQLKALQGQEAVTLDGRRVKLYANIGSTQELALALQKGADGIGLFRSEFIYLERKAFPTEEEQFQIYKQIVEKMNGKRVVFRTLDIGADKQCAYLGMEQEENPALGLRGIRVCLRHPEMFKTQLRALYRASAYGDVGIMYPMIISVEEVRKIKELVEEVKAELTKQGIVYGTPKQGLMIETPAAVMLGEELAREVDFFSIGTNDLTQYTLAIDRQNPKLEEFYNPHHPAVLRMIAMVVEKAHKAGIEVGICGELGADTELTGTLLAMGVDELSVAPGRLPALRKVIRETKI